MKGAGEHFRTYAAYEGGARLRDAYLQRILTDHPCAENHTGYPLGIVS